MEIRGSESGFSSRMESSNSAKRVISTGIANPHAIPCAMRRHLFETGEDFASLRPSHPLAAYAIA